MGSRTRMYREPAQADTPMLAQMRLLAQLLRQGSYERADSWWRPHVQRPGRRVTVAGRPTVHVGLRYLLAAQCIEIAALCDQHHDL